jgi:hypothetical protein
MAEDIRLGEEERFYRMEDEDGWKKDSGEYEQWNGQLKRSNLTIEADDPRLIGRGKKRSGWFLCCW